MVSTRSWPNHKAITVVSTPAWSSRIAAVCLLWRILHKRHTAAVRLLHAPIDTATIALWLGHESDQTTQIYLHADLTLKQRAPDRTAPPGTKPGRYQPPDTLLAFFEAL